MAARFETVWSMDGKADRLDHKLEINKIIAVLGPDYFETVIWLRPTLAETDPPC